MGRHTTGDAHWRFAADQLEEVRVRLSQRPPDVVFTAAEAARAATIERDAIEAKIGPTPSGDERQRPQRASPWRQRL
jgi:hypothetical protein